MTCTYSALAGKHLNATCSDCGHRVFMHISAGGDAVRCFWCEMLADLPRLIREELHKISQENPR